MCCYVHTHTVQQYRAGSDSYSTWRHVNLLAAVLLCMKTLITWAMWVLGKCTESPTYMVASNLGLKPPLFQRFCFIANVLSWLLWFSWPNSGGESSESSFSSYLWSHELLWSERQAVFSLSQTGGGDCFVLPFPLRFPKVVIIWQ